jgi:hypothetical protein
VAGRGYCWGRSRVVGDLQPVGATEAVLASKLPTARIARHTSQRGRGRDRTRVRERMHQHHATRTTAVTDLWAKYVYWARARARLQPYLNFVRKLVLVCIILPTF